MALECMFCGSLLHDAEEIRRYRRKNPGISERDIPYVCKACRDMELRENRSELATVEIYYSDLCPDAQKRLLDGFALSDPKEANWDTYPVFVLYPEIEDPLDCYDDEEE